MARVAGIAVVVATALLGAQPAHAAGGCLTRLPLRVELPSPYAGAYVGARLPLVVSSRGPRIRFLRVGVYTFKGQELAAGSVRGGVGAGQRRVLLPLRFGRMQAGRFTVFASGEPNRNRSCGPKTYSRIQRFLPCPRHLPVTFPRRPEGPTLFYPDRVPIGVRTRGPILRNLTVDLLYAGHAPVAHGTLPVLFGESHIDAYFGAPLAPGPYTALLRGAIDGAPACGRRSALVHLGFG